MSMALAMSVAKTDFIVGNKYRLLRKIGSGSFGDIYLGINVSNGEVRSTVSRETTCQHIFLLVFLISFLFFHSLHNKLLTQFIPWINFFILSRLNFLQNMFFIVLLLIAWNAHCFSFGGFTSCKLLISVKLRLLDRPTELDYFTKFYP